MTLHPAQMLKSVAPQPLFGLAAIARRALAPEGVAGLAADFFARLNRDPDDAAAWLDLSILFQLNGDFARRQAFLAEALRRARHFTHLGGEKAKIRLLALMTAGDFMANAPLEFLVESGEIALDALYLPPGEPLPERLPDHDVLIVAIAESDQHRPLLENLSARAGHWTQPLINAPERVAAISRDGFAALMRGAPGICAPTTRRVSREKLLSGPFEAAPFIIRPIGSHGGQDLARVETAAELSDVLEQNDAEAFFVAPFVDYRGADGFYRKMRLALIDGQPFAVHLAISPRWMIHYLSAEMAENEAFRAEEQAFFENFERDFLGRHGAALAEIHRRCGLDYMQIDCAETADGQLLVFEAGTAMIVHALDPAELYPYKPAQMDKIFAAFAKMVSARAAP